jgi:hypothetical protein
LFARQEVQHRACLGAQVDPLHVVHDANDGSPRGVRAWGLDAGAKWAFVTPVPFREVTTDERDG